MDSDEELKLIQLIRTEIMRTTVKSFFYKGSFLFQIGKKVCKSLNFQGAITRFVINWLLIKNGQSVKGSSIKKRMCRKQTNKQTKNIYLNWNASEPEAFTRGIFKTPIERDIYYVQLMNF